MAIVREYGKPDLFVTVTCNSKLSMNFYQINKQVIVQIEFQKRGLPHAHILMILSPEDKSKTPEDFDKLVCTEIPDRNLQPKLYETISKNMIHGPCRYLNPNSPCMIDGKCSKNYPRDFVEQTTTNKYGYPLYRRRNNEKTIEKRGITI